MTRILLPLLCLLLALAPAFAGIDDNYGGAFYDSAAELGDPITSAGPGDRITFKTCFPINKAPVCEDIRVTVTLADPPAGVFIIENVVECKKPMGKMDFLVTFTVPNYGSQATELVLELAEGGQQATFTLDME